MLLERDLYLNHIDYITVEQLHDVFKHGHAGLDSSNYEEHGQDTMDHMILTGELTPEMVKATEVFWDNCPTLTIRDVKWKHLLDIMLIHINYHEKHNRDRDHNMELMYLRVEDYGLDSLTDTEREEYLAYDKMMDEYHKECERESERSRGQAQADAEHDFYMDAYHEFMGHNDNL